MKGEKGKNGTKGKGKTDGKGAKGDGGADCGCCGLDNHVKSDCRHKHKTCNHCGIAGHLGHMCRKKLAAKQAKGAPADTTGAPKQNAAPLEPWMCLDCEQSNPSIKKRMCSTRFCTGTCPVSYKDAAQKQDAAPTAVSPKTQSHIVDAAPEKIQLTTDELKASIATDKSLIVRFKGQPLLPGTKPMDVTQLEASVAEK